MTDTSKLTPAETAVAAGLGAVVLDALTACRGLPPFIEAAACSIEVVIDGRDFTISVESGHASKKEPAAFWWPDGEDEGLPSLADAMADADFWEVRRVWTGWRVDMSKAIFAVRFPIDSTGDGEADDEDIETFEDFASAQAFVDSAKAGA